MQSWYTIRARATGAELSIYDEIGAYGVSAKQFIADLGALGRETPIELRLNSPGGSVFDAVAIYNALKRHAGAVTVTIDGIAASAASYVAMAGDEIVMPENAFLMIHDPAGLVMGTAEDMRAMAEALDKVKGGLVAGYAAKSGRTAEEIEALMLAETWLDAADALALGFADRRAEPVRIAARFDIGRFRNAPAPLVEAVSNTGAIPPAAPAGGETGAAEDATALPRAEAVAADAASVPDSDGTAGADQPTDAGAPADAAPAAEPAPPPPPEPGTGAAARDARADAMAYARAVVDLCRLAGQPQMAAGFLAEETDLAQVRTALLDARAAAEPEITAQHPQPGASPEARPWGDVIARTFKRKG